MKILLLTDRMETGGAETHISNLAHGLRSLGHEVWLLSAGGSLADQLKASGIRCIHAQFSSRRPICLLKSLRILRKLIAQEHFDVIHAHARLPAFLLRFCRASRTRHVVSVHAEFHLNAILKKLCYWGFQTIAISEDLRQYVCHEYRIPPERVQVIPNGIDCTTFVPPAPRLRKEAPSILFASRLDNDCAFGAFLLCEIAPSLCRRFPGVSISIAGGGSALETVKLHAEAANRIIGRPAIQLLGRVEDMPSTLAKHPIFVGVSRAAMEACATQCAVILCGNEGYGGILSASNAEQAALSNFCARGCTRATAERLEEDLAYLIEHPTERLQYGKTLRRMIETDFNTECVCRETNALYHRLQVPVSRFAVTIGGYFGCDNTGDDAILLGFLEGMRNIAPEIKIQALTGHPHRDRKRFAIRCFHRKNPLSIKLAFAASRAFLCGGGSLLQNLTSRHSLSYYLALLRQADHAGCLPILYAAGIGPLVGKPAILKTTRTLQRSPYLSLRDSASAHLLASYGFDAARLHLGADPAVLLPMPPPTRSAAILQAIGVPPQTPLLCIALHGRILPHISKALLSAVRIVCRRQSLIPILLVLDRRHDLLISQKAAAALDGKCVSPDEPEDAIALISACRAIVSFRLHAIIFATLAKIPALGISADPRDTKIAAFSSAAGQDFLPPHRLSVPTLVESIEKTISDRHRAPILADAVTSMQQQARQDLQSIVDLLHRPQKKEKAPREHPLPRE